MSADVFLDIKVNQLTDKDFGLLLDDLNALVEKRESEGLFMLKSFYEFLCRDLLSARIPDGASQADFLQEKKLWIQRAKGLKERGEL